jgi:tRNA1Val (adenine37-N6)-methyltransferase
MKVGTDGVLLGAWTNVENCTNILDVGTGCGIIAIMIAQRNEEANILGIDIDEAASKQAKDNMAATSWGGRLKAQAISIQQLNRTSTQKFDLIVSNPPFFSGGTFSNNQDRNNIRHTIKMSHSDLLRSAQNMLTPNGRFEVILPFLEGLRFIEMAETYNLYCQKQTSVYPKKDKRIERLLLSFGFEKKELVESSIVIQHEERNDFTKEYIDLTKDFYLKM